VSDLTSDAVRRVFASKHECSPAASTLGRALIARVEQLERERENYERGNLWVRRAAAEKERADAAEAREKQLRDALSRLASVSAEEPTSKDERKPPCGG
jgi:hypothetical protein